MRPLHLIVAVSLVLLFASCEAEDEVISANLFDESASGPRVLNSNTEIRGGTYLIEGNVQITDTGGFNGNYGNNERIVMVIRPKEAGQRVVLDLYQFESEFPSGTTCTEDYLRIYDGDGTTAGSRLDQWCGSINSFFLPWRYVATNVDGALTLEWRSDGSVTSDGFYGQLSLMPSFQSYAVSNLRTTSFGGSAFGAIYETAGPSAVMQNHGICYSTTSSAPSRTNGATCLSAQTNRYGTSSGNLSNNITVFALYFVRAFLTTPNGTVLYSNTSSVVPSAKVMPDFTGQSGAPFQSDVIGSDF
jgi:hypothetical protein